ncbi:kinase-like domain-containing protein [Aspergillus pseudodeflectus]|uniref:Kinase-like domain-containing protein n=1 Tax=Aspergillus pseudodeflectus TaxID=176178 RepID=A0ABR4JIZ1_9EURO
MQFMPSQRPFSQFLRTWGAHYSVLKAHYSIPIPQPTFRRKLSTRPTVTNTFQQRQAEYVGETGRIYTVHRTIRYSPLDQNFLATSDDGQKFFLKRLRPEDFKRYQIVNDRLKDSASHFRLLKDVIPSESMIVYEHYYTSFYRTIRRRNRLPLRMVKKILKSLLNLLAELHDRDVVYGVFGLEDILIDLTEDQGQLTLNKVQLAHSINTVYLPRGSNIVGRQVGPRRWRSPEATILGPVNKPSDIFSFALLCIFAVYRRVVFNDILVKNHEKSDIQISILERQISYFADRKGLEGFMKYIGKEHPLSPMIELTWDGFHEGNPRKPFSKWENVHEDFRSLILAMTNFDPSKRITARQALEHKWFEDVEVVQQDDRPEIQESNQDSSLVLR